MKRYIVFVALLLVMSAGAFAQLDFTGWKSPQNSATAGRYRSAADNFIRPDAFTGVSFKTFYAVASFADNSMAQLGFATKISNMYLGVAYRGKFWSNFASFDYTETEVPNWGGVAGNTKTVPVYSRTNIVTDPFDSTEPLNSVAILLGLPDMNMGFRLAFTTDYQYKKFEASVISSIQVKSAEAGDGKITPQLAWSMTKALTDKGIQPYVVLDLAFVSDFRKYEEADGSGTRIGTSKNNFAPTLSVGLGGYTLYQNESNFKLTADLAYALSLYLYANEYSYLDPSNNDWKTKKVNGTWNGSTVLQEYSASNNTITPSLAGQWSGGPLALKFQLSLPIAIDGSITQNKSIDADFKDLGDKSTQTTVSFIPKLSLGAQWKVFSMLTFNIGDTVVFNDGSYLQTTQAAHKTVKSVSGNTTNKFSLGVTFMPTENLSFEATNGISTTNNGLDTFATGSNGLFFFGGLLASLKF